MKNILLFIFFVCTCSCKKDVRVRHYQSIMYYAEVVGFSHNKFDSLSTFLFVDLDRDSISDTRIKFDEKIFKSYYEKYFFYQVQNIPTLMKAEYFLEKDSLSIVEIGEYSFDNNRYCKINFKDTTFVFSID